MSEENDRVRVLVVDDSAASRAAIGEAVAHVTDFELVAAVASGREALEVLPHLKPELVLLDVRMHGLNGVETSRLIRASGARAAVVLVSALHRSELPAGVFSCGAAAILHKSKVSPRRLSALWRRLTSDHADAGVESFHLLHRDEQEVLPETA
jgi:DNA-binding NarL/FixJ family response regulator